MSNPNTQPEFDDSLLSAYVDGELTSAERALVEARLADDPQARQLVAELEAVSTKLRSLPRAKLTGDLRAAVLDRLEQPKATLPPSELSMGKRLLWPLLATAALVFLMIYQTEVKEDQIQVAQNQKAQDDRILAKEKSEFAAREVPAIGAIEAMPEADAIGSPKLLAETAPSDEASSEELAASGAGRKELKRDIALDSVAPSAPLRAGRAGKGLTSSDSNVGLVHITLTDLRSGAEHFDRLLVSNGIQILDESEPEAEGIAPAEASDGKATFQDSRLFAESRSGGYGGGAARQDAPSEGAEMVLVEAPAEQIAQFLLACNQDTDAIESVTIDEPQEPESGEQLEQFRQYEKPARNLASEQKYVVTPAQQGMIAALNSLDLPQEPPPAGPASAGLQQQAWATRLRANQPPIESKQFENEVQSLRNQAYNFANRDQSADKHRELAKKDADLPQQVRVLFLLHPSEAKK